jgi:hypothetical protein
MENWQGKYVVNVGLALRSDGHAKLVPEDCLTGRKSNARIVKIA